MVPTIYSFYISGIVDIFPNKIYFNIFLFFLNAFNNEKMQELEPSRGFGQRLKRKKQSKSEIKWEKI